MSIYLWIAFGSALGGTARFALSGFVARHIGETFPWGTFVIKWGARFFRATIEYGRAGGVGTVIAFVFISRFRR